LIAGAKVIHFCLYPKFFGSFFIFFVEKHEKVYIFIPICMKFALSLQRYNNIKASTITLRPNHAASKLQMCNFKQ